MRLEPSQVPVRDLYQLLIGLVTPRPIAWVSTLSARGVVNLAPFSFFNAVAANPPTLMFSCVDRRDGTRKDTVRNLHDVPEFVVSVCSYAQREAINETSAELDYEVSELDACGLTALPSETVRPPRVAGSPAHFECKVHQIVRLGDGPLAPNVVIGKIQLIHVRDDVFDDHGAVDPRKLDTIGRIGGIGYVRTTDLFDLPRPSAKATR